MMMSLFQYFPSVDLKYQNHAMRAFFILLMALVVGHSQFSFAGTQKGEPSLKQVIE